MIVALVVFFLFVPLTTPAKYRCDYPLDHFGFDFCHSLVGSILSLDGNGISILVSSPNKSIMAYPARLVSGKPIQILGPKRIFRNVEPEVVDYLNSQTSYVEEQVSAMSSYVVSENASRIIVIINRFNAVQYLLDDQAAKKMSFTFHQGTNLYCPGSITTRTLDAAMLVNNCGATTRTMGIEYKYKLLVKENGKLNFTDNTGPAPLNTRHFWMDDYQRGILIDNMLSLFYDFSNVQLDESSVYEVLQLDFNLLNQEQDLKTLKFNKFFERVIPKTEKPKENGNLLELSIFLVISLGLLLSVVALVLLLSHRTKRRRRLKQRKVVITMTKKTAYTQSPANSSLKNQSKMLTTSPSKTQRSLIITPIASTTKTRPASMNKVVPTASSPSKSKNVKVVR